MFTRVEIENFKSFQDAKLDLEPFCVIAGPNAAGKSNFFDALRLLSRLADADDVRTALQGMRGEPHELFRKDAKGQPASRMKLAVEVLLDRFFVDPYGKRHELKNTRLRYEVGIERRSDGPGSMERLYVWHEQAELILRNDDRLFKRSSQYVDSLRSWAPANRSKVKLISPVDDGYNRSIEVTQDGSAGRKRTLPLREATATFLSTLRSGSEFLHLSALRKELASLRFLQIDPTAEREPSDALDSDELKPDGSNLATVLARLAAETSTPDRPRGVLNDIRSDLAQLIPGIIELETDHNAAARHYQLFLTMRDNGRFSSRVLSDGTLRLLALLSVLHDPRRRGVLCFEEPENGVHEAKIKGLISLLRSACTDLRAPPSGDDEALSQIIVNTHSPEVLRHLNFNEIVVADVVSSMNPDDKSITRQTRLRRLPHSDEGLPLGDGLTRIEAEQLLRRDMESIT